MALMRFGPQIATDALQLGGRSMVAAAAASAGPAIVDGRITARGVEQVVRKLANILETTPHLCEELSVFGMQLHLQGRAAALLHANE